MGAHKQNLARVSTRIGGLIDNFITERIVTNQPEFFMDELREYVRNNGVIAPDSPGRILRQKRLDGEIDYVVISRSRSRYKLLMAQTSGAATNVA